jgi:trk system potassium uptake protein TrkA
MYVVIVGGGRTGTQLARVLLSQDLEVHVVEERSEVLSRLHREIPTELIHEGSIMDPNLLEQAGIQRADVIAAVTSSDEQNLIVCYVARERYGVPRTIARVNNPRNEWLFNDTFHVDVDVNATQIMSRVIAEEMSMGDMMILAKLRRGNYSLVVERILDGAPAIGKSIIELKFPDNCVIATIIRDEKVIVPRGMTRFEAEDEVYAVADPIGSQILKSLFSVKENE